MSSRTPALTTIVQAGAGTGKTESLAKEIVAKAKHIYQTENRIPRLVATTFTERATAELRERVIQVISRDKTAPQWLADYGLNTRDLQISTLHGVFAQVLRRYGSALDLDPGFQILTQSEFMKLLREVGLSQILKPEFEDLLDQYEFSQLVSLMPDLALSSSRHLLKQPQDWKVLVRQDAEKLREAIQRLVTADFTLASESINEKISRIRELRPLVNSGVTYEEMREKLIACLKGVRKPGKIGKGFEELKDDFDFIFELKAKWDDSGFDPSINEEHQRLMNLVGKLADQMARELTELKKARGFLSFDDLESLTLKLVQDSPAVATKIQQDWDHWFIDEFQDTSPVQMKVLEKVFKPNWNAYFVGDPQQSIYLFRGADVRVFKDVVKKLEVLGVKPQALIQNFRSHPDLLKALNEIFRNMNPPMMKLEPKGSYENSVRCDLWLTPEKSQETPYIAEKISEWRELGYGFDQMAILVRTNREGEEIGRSLNQMGIPCFVHSGGGFYSRQEINDCISLLGFLIRPSDDVALISFLRSPFCLVEDKILVDWCRQKEKMGLWAFLEGQPEILDSCHGTKILKQARANLEHKAISQVIQETLESLGVFDFGITLDPSGAAEFNLRKLIQKIRAAEVKPHFSIQNFLDTLKEERAEDAREAMAPGFIEPDRLNIMTVHKSKGLKFDCVIIPGCGKPTKGKSEFLEISHNGEFSLKIMGSDSEEYHMPILHQSLAEQRLELEFEESMRTFYVAITRAAEQLALIGTASSSKKSWYSRLNPALLAQDQDHPGGIRIRLKSEARFEAVADTKAEEKADPLLTFVKPKVNQPRNFTVTEVVGRIAGETERNVALNPTALSAIQKGQALHYLFENLNSYEARGWDEAIGEVESRFGVTLGIKRANLERALAQSEVPLREVISQGHLEFPFEVQVSGLRLMGQIDAWGFDSQGRCWILDYKSALRVNQDRIDLAARQLELYALALAENGVPWDKIHLAAVFPSAGETKCILLRPKNEIIDSLDRFVKQDQSASQSPA
ncbi:MAG: UvrD-helicase domain-containing protein [Oligoflexia bacterium]|nr:UvrD-helicase domain-containing protein [Oligoflexia bacterium]